MNTLTYRCLGDHRTYVLTCNDESLDLYIKLFFENDVYKVNLNDELLDTYIQLLIDEGCYKIYVNNELRYEK